MLPPVPRESARARSQSCASRASCASQARRAHSRGGRAEEEVELGGPAAAVLVLGELLEQAEEGVLVRVGVDGAGVRGRQLRVCGELVLRHGERGARPDAAAVAAGAAAFRDGEVRRRGDRERRVIGVLSGAAGPVVAVEFAGRGQW